MVVIVRILYSQYMEFHITQQKDRRLTKCLFNRFLRTAGELHNEVKLIRTYANQTGFTGARLEMPPQNEDTRTKQILGLAAIDGLVIVPVLKEVDT